MGCAPVKSSDGHTGIEAEPAKIFHRISYTHPIDNGVIQTQFVYITYNKISEVPPACACPLGANPVCSRFSTPKGFQPGVTK